MPLQNKNFFISKMSKIIDLRSKHQVFTFLSLFDKIPGKIKKQL